MNIYKWFYNKWFYNLENMESKKFEIKKVLENKYSHQKYLIIPFQSSIKRGDYVVIIPFEKNKIFTGGKSA